MTCGTCTFFDCAGFVDECTGLCRAFPPIAGEWPQVSHDDHCGQHNVVAKVLCTLPDPVVHPPDGGDDHQQRRNVVKPCSCCGCDMVADDGQDLPLPVCVTCQDEAD